MSERFSVGPKIPGKTIWAERRRAATRTSGYSVKASGSMYREVSLSAYELRDGDWVLIEFRLPPTRVGEFVGFGGWYAKSPGIALSISGFPSRAVLLDRDLPLWSKYGSLWRSTGELLPQIQLRFTATRPGIVALFGENCGRVEHEYLRSARPELLVNMYQFAPEANFIAKDGAGGVQTSVNSGVRLRPDLTTLVLKSCNRCTRFLPVNLVDETVHLSFTNHCTAETRRPCRHPGFGRLTSEATGAQIQLQCGFQLECRYCKKFEVNAAHNPQRTAAQMKEDAARRRAFEVLLEHLFGGTPNLQYKRRTGRELASDVYTRFDGRCFKCDKPFRSINEMHLDHTRPLALLWPLDGTATALCGDCNSNKRDRAPHDYYSLDELARLSRLTGLSMQDLSDPRPNMEAIQLLAARLDWFRSDFLKSDVLNRENDGKLPRDLLLKALKKALAKCPGGPPFSL